MSHDFSKIDQLVSDFESGLPVDSILAEINADEDLRWQWGYENRALRDDKNELVNFKCLMPIP